MFAIHASDHYYIVSYDLRFGTCDIIDSSSNGDVSKYTGWADQLVRDFYMYCNNPYLS